MSNFPVPEMSGLTDQQQSALRALMQGETYGVAAERAEMVGHLGVVGFDLAEANVLVNR